MGWACSICDVNVPQQLSSIGEREREREGGYIESWEMYGGGVVGAGIVTKERNEVAS